MNIPQTWTLTQLGNLTAQIVGGGTPSKTSAANFNGHIPFMTVKDLKARFVNTTVDHISEEALQSSATTKVPADTLIVATRMSLGKIARPTMDVAINQDLKALFLHGGVNKTFVEYFWRSKSQAIQSMGTGTTVKGIRLEDIRSLEVPLAPVAEQKRIADKLDTVLTRVDAVNTRLARVAPLLKRFRQSVLAAATSGRLTEDWREIRETAPWTDKRIEDVAKVFLGRQRSPVNHEGPFMRRYVRAANVTWSGWDLSDVKEMNFDADDFERYRLQKNDILLNEGSGSADEVGKPAIWNEEIPDCCFQNTLICVRPETVDAKFMFLVLLHAALTKRFVDSTRGVNIHHIGKQNMARFPVAVPNADEQTEIVRRVETLFAFADRLEARLAQAQTAATRLTPALLAKAFRGELVPQDPNDEPAAELLRRLQAERASAPKASTGRGRKAAVQV
jgi:type I restriction enzyme S subunit